MKVGYVYLKQQYAPARALTKDIFRDLHKTVDLGDFTLGEPVRRFEETFATKYGVRHAIGVGNGTDALILALGAIGVRGKPVRTQANSFIATAGAIVAAGGVVRFNDVHPNYLMQMSSFERDDAVMLPVALTGNLNAEWPQNPPFRIVVDAAQAVGCEVNGVSVAAMGDLACFSLHPLKNLNVWGDGGVVTTNNDEWAAWLRLARNHGLRDRDVCVMAGVNSRLDSVQAVVAYHGLREIDWVNERRRENAARYDTGLSGISGVTIPYRHSGVRQVFHTYVIQVERRIELRAYLAERGVETKVHYPIPIHLQPGYEFLGYGDGSLPETEAQANRILSLPIHQYLRENQIDYVVERIRAFYEGRHRHTPGRIAAAAA